MADSLRDQLIAAGFDAPKKPVRKAAKKKQGNKRRPDANKDATKKGSGNKSVKNKPDKNAGAEAKALERKKLKTQIKEMIDANKLENWKGDIAYRYTVEKRIRELYVNAAAHKHLTARTVAITRLNGDTYLIPGSVATGVIKINPQWSVFNTVNESIDAESTVDDEYSEFQVPDDLQW